MTERFAFIYSHRFSGYSYGRDHPFKVQRYRLAYELMEALGVLAAPGLQLVECPAVSEEALLSFHRRDYLDRLREFSAVGSGRADFLYGLGDVENPVFPGLYGWARLACGGSVEAARQVVEEGCRLAFSMAGGWHHAHAARASGFSYLNDAVVAINGLLARGLRVAYVDIDAHHGDGVQEAFYDTDRVLTISLHETGKDFFPRTGFVREMGCGAGYGYAVNVPFAPHSDDLVFEQGFTRVVLPLLQTYRPDVLVTQLGVDTLRTDPLSRLELTTRSIEFAVRAFRDTGFPWVALGGGGYDRCNVARGWALAWAAMIDRPVDDLLPPAAGESLAALGVREPRLRDLPHLASPDDFARAERALEANLAFLERRLFPCHGITANGGG